MNSITHIIKGCIVKDHKYQKMVYEQYRGFAFKMAFRYIYVYDKAMEVVNDGFVKLFNHFDSFRLGTDEENERILLGWLKKIIINTAIDQLRKEQLLPEIGGMTNSTFEVSNNQYDADQTTLYNDLIALVKQLPPHYRIAFNLYVIDGYSHAEIADMMNTTIGTSKSHLSRARVLLQNGIRKMEEPKYARS